MRITPKEAWRPSISSNLDVICTSPQTHCVDIFTIIHMQKLLPSFPAAVVAGCWWKPFEQRRFERCFLALIWRCNKKGAFMRVCGRLCVFVFAFPRYQPWEWLFLRSETGWMTTERKTTEEKWECVCVTVFTWQNFNSFLWSGGVSVSKENTGGKSRKKWWNH